MYFKVFLLSVVVSLGLGATPLRAQNTVSQSQCTQLGLLVGIVDIISVFMQDSTRDTPEQFKSLERLTETLNDFELHRLLNAAGKGDQYTVAQQYITDVGNFVSVRRVNGRQFGGWIFNRDSFQIRHQVMQQMIKDMCDTSPVEEVFTLLDRVVEQLGLGESAGETAPRSAPRKIQNISSDAPGWSKPFRVRKEMLLLAQVFFLLAVSLLSLIVVRLLMNFVNAVRLDRYSCSIPATLEVGGHEILGRIDVLGKKGVSFEVTETTDPVHDQQLTLNRHVKFITETIEFFGVLTKEFDGSAGFRLPVPLHRDQIRTLLKLSETRPKLMLEMRKKKSQRSRLRLRWLKI